MARIRSLFGAYAENMQVYFDNSQASLQRTWFMNYFRMGIPTATLDFATVIGRSRIEAMASVISRDASAPLRSRALLEKLQGSIPTIQEKFKLKEDDYRQWLTLRDMRGISDQVQLNAVLELVYGDAEKAAMAPLKRIDAMCLEAVSTGQITINVGNNPDGMALSAPIDLGMPDTNRKDATAAWSNASTAKPIDDIQTVVLAANDEGKSVSKILMTRAKFLQMIRTDQVKGVLTGYFNLANINIPTFEQVNQYLVSNLFPPIEIVDWVTGIESDGKITTYRPFAADAVSFIPDGNLGVIHNALAMEEISPIEQVNYATNGRVLVSKWGENDPFAEFTKGELNAFPGVEAIDNIFILDTNP